jgi:hypothetical protein
MRTRFITIAVLLLAALTSVLAASPPAGATTSARTRQVVVRPVHADGTPVAGYTVRTEHWGSDFTCHDQSLSAVDTGIDQCGSTASNTGACWRSTHHTVLCLRLPRVKQLVRIPYYGTFTRTGPLTRKAPASMVLPDDVVCHVRLGGAWSSPPSHPSWVGWDYCTTRLVYGPRTSDYGIDRTHPVWTVHLLNTSLTAEHVTPVEAAYFVGTAA